jgi:hypothetical protein
VVDRRDDGEAELRGSLSSPALREMMFGCGRMKLNGLWSTSGS